MEDIRRLEVLLIEDSEEDAELTIHALRKYNFANHLMHVEDGEEALEYIFCEGRYADRDIDDFPQLVLLDLKMPKVSGLEVLQRLKSDQRTKHIPVIVLTSSAEEKDISESYTLGVNSYIVKPVDFNKFVDTIKELGFYWLVVNEPPAYGKKEE